jgi:hypothetical protein
VRLSEVAGADDHDLRPQPRGGWRPWRTARQRPWRRVPCPASAGTSPGGAVPPRISGGNGGARCSVVMLDVANPSSACWRSVMTCSRVSPGTKRRSQRISHRSGMMFRADCTAADDVDARRRREAR